MRVVVDTNVILDILLNRKEFYDSAYGVLKLAAQNRIDCSIIAGSITDIYYIIKRSTDHKTAKEAIIRIIEIVSVSDIQPGDIRQALLLDMRDFEDAVLSCAAKRIKADCIITRNAKDFVNSPVESITPPEFIKRYSNSMD